MRAARLLGLVFCITVAGASPASAGTLSYADGLYTYLGGAAANDVNVNRLCVIGRGSCGGLGEPNTLRFTDTAGITVGTSASSHGCSLNGGTLGATTVDCPDDAVSLTIDLGDANDSVVLSNIAFPSRLAGGAGADTVTGGAGRDFVYAGAINATADPELAINHLSGGAGEDVIYGAASADSISGGAGPDTLYGNDGSDNIDAGPGDDPLVDGGAGMDIIAGGDGNDTDINGGADNDVITPGLGDDGTIDGGTGDDRISYDDGRSNAVTVDLSSSAASNDGGADDNPTATARESAVNFEQVRGTEQGDTLIGNSAENGLFGAGGDDILSGRDGADFLSGAAGDDTLDGGAGGDTISGDSGFDTVDYSARTEPVLVYLGVGSAISGGVADGNTGARDLILSVERALGGEADDFLYAAAEGSTLHGGGGRDSLIGADGPDTFDGGSGPDSMTGSGGTDTASYAGRSEPVSVTLGGSGGADDGGAADGAAGSRDSVSGVENAVGGSGDDSLIGTDGANLLDGGDGADALLGGAGVDTYFGRAGADTITAKDGVVENVDCGDGTDTGDADTDDVLTSCEGINAPVAPADRGTGVAPSPSPSPSPAPAGPVAGTAPAFALIASTLSVRTSAKKGRTTFKTVTVKTIPARGTVLLTCKAKRKKVCPFKRFTKTYPAGKATLKLTSRLKKKKFPAGVVIALRVTAPNTIGKVHTYTTRKTGRPARKLQCLVPGSTKPGACP